MMHQADSQAWKRVAFGVRQMNAELIFRRQQAACIRIVAAEPRGIETHDVNRNLPAWQ